MLADFLVKFRYQLFQIFYEGTTAGKSSRDISDHDHFEAYRGHI